METARLLPDPIYAQALELNINNRDCVVTFYRWDLPYTLVEPRSTEASHVVVARVHLPHSTARELRDLLASALEVLEDSDTQRRDASHASDAPNEQPS